MICALIEGFFLIGDLLDLTGDLLGEVFCLKGDFGEPVTLFLVGEAPLL